MPGKAKHYQVDRSTKIVTLTVTSRRLLEVQHNGRFIVGTFRLTARPGQTCLTEGALVRVAFVISDRHFTEWRQIPDTPGASPGPSQPEDLQTLPRPGPDGETA